MAGVVVVVVVKAIGDVGKVTVFGSVGGNGVNIKIIVECKSCCPVVILLDVVKKLESSGEV